MKRIFFFMAAVLIMEATGLHAENKSGTELSPYVLADSIAVTANRNPTPLHEIASSITVVSQKQIENSQSAFVSHLLRNVPGVDIVQSGGTGKFTSVFIRGSNAHHALVLLDGIPLNDPSSPNNAADLSNLITANVERIEILRGPQSVLYGPEAIGGVVQIFTKTGKNQTSASVVSEGGSFGSYNLSGGVSGSYQDLGYSFSAERLKTNGISSVAGTTERDGYKNNSFSSRLDYSISKSLRLNFVGRYTDLESDLDKTSAIFDDPDFAATQKEQEYKTQVIREDQNSNWHQEFSIYYGDIERTSFDNFDTDHPSDSESTFATGERIGASFLQSVKFSANNKLSVGAETEKIAFTSDLFFRSEYGDFADTVGEKHSWSRGIYLFDQHQIGQYLYLTIGGRIDEHRQFGSTGAYRLTVAYWLDNTGTNIRGVLGSGYKAPSVFQLYHPSPYIGNPNLKPEKSRSWEVGIDQDIVGQTVALSFTYFHNEYDDLIVGTENIDNAAANGFEAGIDIQTGNLHSRADYTYCDSRDEITGEVLIRRPKSKLTASTEYEFTDKVLLNISVRLTGKREDLDFSQFPSPRVDLGNYTVISLGALYEISKHLKLTSRIENLLDENYQEVYSYGTMPFSVFAGIRISN